MHHQSEYFAQFYIRPLVRTSLPEARLLRSEEGRE